MAKNEKSGKGGNSGKGGKGNLETRNADMIQKSQAGIDRKRNLRKTREKTREQIAKNPIAGYSSDILALVNGMPGHYAFPSVDVPAFCVEAVQENVKEGVMLFVVRIEEIQKDHEQWGSLHNNTSYLPVRHIGNPKFVSALNNSAKHTQELLWAYLSKMLVERQAKERELALAQKEEEEKSAIEDAKKIREERIAAASHSMEDLAQGKFGGYILPNCIVVSLEKHASVREGVLKVLKSPEGSKLIAGDSWYLHVWATRAPTLVKFAMKMSDAKYSWMCELHATIRMYLKEGIKHVDTVEVKESETAKSVPYPAPPIDVSRASRINFATYDGKEGVYFFDDYATRKKAYFEVSRIGGAKSITLFYLEEGFDQGHVLSKIMHKHEKGLHVDLHSLKRIITSYESNSLDDVREARKALHVFLRDLGHSLGIKAKVGPSKAPSPFTPVIHVGSRESESLTIH